MHVPLTVPPERREEYLKNYTQATQNSGRLFLFAADQKIEHLNEDFYGDGISPDAADPEHLFKIASQGRIGAFATHLGLIARYGDNYREIPYVVKLNGKSNIIPVSQADPQSSLLCSPHQVHAFGKQSGLRIVGVGYTLYLGSQYETQMLHEASKIILEAHSYGLLAIIWIYPRGKAVHHERAAHIIAGAAGVGASLGADFIKVNPPEAETGEASAQLLKQAVTAAGKSKIICSGGKPRNESVLLEELSAQLMLGGASGCAIGRNIFTRPLYQAIRLTQAIALLFIDGKDLTEAQRCLKEGI